MTRFDEHLKAVARDGRAAYDAAPAPEGYAQDYVAGVRAVRRRRVAATGAVVTVAVLALGAVGVQLLDRGQAGPANPVTTEAPGELVWSLDMGAESWSSPALVDNIVVVGANDGVVRAVDLAAGTVAWEVETGGDVRAEPLIDGDAIYVNSDDGRLYRLGVDGSLAWSTAVSGPVVARDQYSQRSSRPAVAAELVIAASARDGVVRAFDRDTGAPVWEFATRAPVTGDVAVGDRTVVVAGEDSNLYALDAATGTELWVMSMGSPIVSSPAIVDGLAITGSRGTEVVAFDLATGARVWSVPMAGGSWAESSIDVDGDTVYFGSSSAGEVIGADVATGTVLWRAAVGGWPWARPTADGNTVYATAGRTSEHEPWDFAIYALDRDTGTQVWREPTGEALEWRPAGSAYGAMTSPALTEHLVIVAGLDGVLYAIAR